MQTYHLPVIVRQIIRPLLIAAAIVCNELPTVRCWRFEGEGGGWRGDRRSCITAVHNTRIGALLDVLNPRDLWQSEDYHVDCYLRLNIWHDYDPTDNLRFVELFRVFDRWGGA